MMKIKLIIGFIIILQAILLFVHSVHADTITLNVYPINTTVNINYANIVLTGKLYAEDIWLESISDGITQAAPDETFIASVVKMNRNGLQADVLNTWNPDERSKMSSYVNNAVMFSKSQNWYKAVKYSAFLAKMIYGEFTVFAVQHSMQSGSNIILLYPIKNVSGSYYLTNQLSEDPIFVSYMVKVKYLVPYKSKK